MEDSVSDLVLGIDIGTSSVKACIVERENERTVCEFTGDSNAFVQPEVPGGDEQSVEKILTCIYTCMGHMAGELLARVSCIAVCGQMHGCVLWKSDPAAKVETSNLITWQDGRCTEDFLRTLPRTAQHTRISTGYGCASIAWLQRNCPSFLDRFDRAGTIMDLFVCQLCGSTDPVMSTHNANSWGFFDLQSNQWELELLKNAKFPVDLLPLVVEPGAVAGHTATVWHHVPKGTPVLAAMGDLQCSTLSVLPGPRDAVLNIGTSSQLAVVTDKDAASKSIANSSTLLQVPYFDGQHLVVAATLTGGNAMAHFVKQLQSWCTELGISAPQRETIYQRLFDSARKMENSLLHVVPMLWGERHLPSGRGTVSHLDTFNGSLGDITHAVCRGIVTNIKKMMPGDILESSKVECIVGCGSALLQNELLQRYVRDEFTLPLQLRGVSAAFGAALSTKFQEAAVQ